MKKLLLVIFTIFCFTMVLNQTFACEMYATRINGKCVCNTGYIQDGAYCGLDHQTCKNLYGNNAEMKKKTVNNKPIGECGCKTGYALYYNSITKKTTCELITKICTDKHGINAKSQGTNLCTCKDGYKFANSTAKVISIDTNSSLKCVVDDLNSSNSGDLIDTGTANNNTKYNLDSICQEKYGPNEVWIGKYDETGQPILTCDCKEGYYRFNDDTTCKTRNEVCTEMYGENSYWGGKFNEENIMICDCKEGYTWSSNDTCIIDTKVITDINTTLQTNNNQEIDSANYLAQKGIINNHSNNPSEYNLNRNVLRQEIAGISVGISGVNKDNTCYNVFQDVTATTPNNWACYNIEALANNGLIALNEKFRPEENISKAEALGMVIKAVYGDEYIYDSNLSGTWQEQLVSFAVSKGITDKFTDYNVTASRGFVFNIASNALRIKGDNNTTSNIIDEQELNTNQEVAGEESVEEIMCELLGICE